MPEKTKPDAAQHDKGFLVERNRQGSLPMPPEPDGEAPRPPHPRDAFVDSIQGNLFTSQETVQVGAQQGGMAASAAAKSPATEEQVEVAEETDGEVFRRGQAFPAGNAFNLAAAPAAPLPVADTGRVQQRTETSDDETANYYDWKVLFPELKVLILGLSEITAECERIAAWKSWPEDHKGEGGAQDWKVFPFVHTFPANDESQRTWVDATCSRCPTTVGLLRRLPNIRTALFSRLGGGSRISGHRGWADLSNHVLRCHLPLKVPSDGACGLWVNREVRCHAEGEIIVFDDSKLHKAFNESTTERLVLIVDILRPPGIPLGTAEGGHTPELDAFIDAFR